MIPEDLDFDFLDDVLSLSDEEIEKVLHRVEAPRIGPVVSLVYGRFLAKPSLFDGLGDNPILRNLLDLQRQSDNKPYLSSNYRSFEFFKIPRTEDEVEDNSWASFLLRAQRAAERSGIEKSLAQSLISTLQEMVDNAIIHSQHPESGLAGYQWSEKSFEYVVADAGIGVFASLQQSSRYASIENSSEALSTALRNGETSKPTGYGTGFNGLILNIAKKNSSLRFHTGDASITIDGISRYDEVLSLNPIARPAPAVQGFLISVLCETPD